MPRSFGRLLLLGVAALLCRADGKEDFLSNKTEVARLRKDEDIQDSKITTSADKEETAMEAKESAEEKAQKAVLADNVQAEREAEVEEKKAEVQIEKAEADVQQAEMKKASLLAAEAKMAAAEAEAKELKLQQELQEQHGLNKKQRKELANEILNKTMAEGAAEAELRKAEHEVEGLAEQAIVPIEQRHFHFMSMVMLVMFIVFFMKLHLQRRKILQERLMEACGVDGGADDMYQYGAYRPMP